MPLYALLSGPWLWFAPDGAEIVAHSPQEVGIIAVWGAQSGDNSWNGLLQPMTEVLENQRETAPWVGHSCDSCRKDILVDGEYYSVQAAAVDGITATPHAKCIFHGCKLGLPVERTEVRSDRILSDMGGLDWTTFDENIVDYADNL